MAIFPVFSVCHIQGRASPHRSYAGERSPHFSAALTWNLASATSSSEQGEWNAEVLLLQGRKPSSWELGEQVAMFLAAAVCSRPLRPTIPRDSLAGRGEGAVQIPQTFASLSLNFCRFSWIDIHLLFAHRAISRDFEYLCVCMHMYMSVYLCMYIFIYISTNIYVHT